MELVYLVGAVAWFSTALVHKSGPFGLFQKVRDFALRTLGETNSPLSCSFCTGFWVLIPLLILSHVAPYVVQFFGILGIAAAVRGLSAEY